LQRKHTSIHAVFFFDQNLSRLKSFYAERSYVPRKRNTNIEKEGQQLMLKSFSNTGYWLCLRLACRILICLYIRSCCVVISRSQSKYVNSLTKVSRYHIRQADIISVSGDFLSSVNKRKISHLHQSVCALHDLRKHAVSSVNTSE